MGHMYSVWLNSPECGTGAKLAIYDCLDVQMLQLALRQQQLHAAHMQIKLQHQSKLVTGEHSLHHHHHHLHHLQQQQQQQQTGTSSADVDHQLSSPSVVPTCPPATSATWRTDDEPHDSTTSPTAHTTSAEQPSLRTITRVCTPVRPPWHHVTSTSQCRIAWSALRPLLEGVLS